MSTKPFLCTFKMEEMDAGALKCLRFIHTYIHKHVRRLFKNPVGKFLVTRKKLLTVGLKDPPEYQVRKPYKITIS